MASRYDQLRTSTEALPNTRSGSDEDRTAGLDCLARATIAGTVLDIGCNDGVVDDYFAAHGAARCVGVDFYRAGLDACRVAAARWPATTGAFHLVDLVGGDAAIATALHDEPARFTTVLYLGVHHHLLREMKVADAERLVDGLLLRADRYFAVRTSAALIETLSPRIEAAGWSRWYDDDSALPRVNPLTVFARRPAA